jgi:two-component sensor histidine kinase
MDAVFIWPTAVWWKARCISFFCGAAVLYGTIFSGVFLSLVDGTQTGRRWVYAISAASVFEMVFSLIGPVSLAGPFGSVLAIIFVVFAIGAGFYSIKAGNNAARYYLSGAAMLFAGIIFNSLKNFGRIKQSFFTDYGNQAGSALAIMFLSLAIADRMMKMRAEKSCFAAMAHEQELKAVKEQKKGAEFRLQALQAKINPHFLFNTLNTITGLIRRDANRAEDIVARLSRLFRYTLSGSMARFVTVAEELDTVKNYLEIEKNRFDERLDFSVNCSEQAKHMLVPALTVQPIVENSIKHGISPRIEGGRVSVKAWVDGTVCTIEVADNGVGFGKHGEGGTGHGLNNVRERIDLAFEGKSELTIKEAGGVIVVMSFPAKET